MSKYSQFKYGTGIKYFLVAIVKFFKFTNIPVPLWFTNKIDSLAFKDIPDTLSFLDKPDSISFTNILDTTRFREVKR